MSATSGEPATPSWSTAAVRATRPLYLPTSVLPALCGCLVAIGRDDVAWGLLPLVLIGALLLHAGTNVCNDVEDFAAGVDQPGKVENSGVFIGGQLTVAQGRRLYAGLFVAALVLGVLLSALSTWWVLVWGVLGLLGGWLYTGGPRPFKYVGLGDPLIVLLMGPFLTQGAFTALTGVPFDGAAFAVGLVPGFLIAAVLQSNNAADIADDSAAGVRTLAVRLGDPWASRAVALSLGAVVLAPVVLVVAGLLGPALLVVLLTAPVLLGHARTAVRAGADGAHGRGGGCEPLTPQIAQAHLLTSVLLGVGITLSLAF